MSGESASGSHVGGAVDRFTRTSLRWQMCFFTCLSIAISLVAMGWFAFSQASSQVTELTLDALAAETSAAVSEIQRVLDDTRADVEQTPQFPPVPGIVRCEDNNGMDPEQPGSDTSIWIDRLATIVGAQMRQHSERLWTAVIDVKGREILRVDRSTGLPALSTAPATDLSRDKFFQSALQAAAGEIVTSKMERSGEQATLRVATPYFDRTNNVRGAFLIALDGDRILASAAKRIQSGTVDIIDESGMYLFSEAAPMHAFSTRPYSQDKPVRARLLNDPRSDDTYRELIDGSLRPDGVSLIAGFERLYYADGDKTRFFAVAPDIVAAEALEPVSALARRFWILGLSIILVAAVVTFAASRGLTAALSTVTRTANEIAAGNLDAELPRVRSLGEVRTLATSVRAMTNNLRQSLQSSRAEEKRTSAILDSTADGILTLNENGEVLSANRAANGLFRTRNGELVGSNAGRFVPALTSDASAHDNSQLAEGEVRTLGDASEVSGLRSDGSSFPLAMSVAEMDYSGERLFIATLQDITQRHRFETERQRVFDGIRSAVARLASAIAQIQAQTQEQASAAQQQASSVSETTATVKEITETAEQSTQLAKDVAGSSRRADEVSRTGTQAVDETIDAMRHVQEQTESTAENILTLAERAQAIAKIITTVNELADQTNLLALNAAIEASRAGEHGKGFAVVASEVKTLADQSRKATEQVRQILGEIQQATNTAVMSTEQGTKSVVSAQQVVSRASETINDLARTMSDAARSAQQIVASAGQQSTGMKQIRDAMAHIDASTRQTLTATRQAEDAARDLAQLRDELETLTEQSRVAEPLDG